MRRLIVSALALAIALVGVPAALSAQTLNAMASVSGQAVDAGGRAAAGQRVELVQNGVVVQTAKTGVRGDFSFASVPAGDYIVRVMINNVPAGIRVSLKSGVAATNATIVLPSAVAPQGAMIGSALSVLGTTGGIIVGSAIVIGSAVVITKAITSGS